MAKEKKGTGARPGDKVELADKDTGFYDSQTEFKIVRDQQAQLRDTIGRKTMRALASGALLIVDEGRRSSAKASKSEEKTDLPGDDSGFPEDLLGRDVLISSGLTAEKLRAWPAEGRMEKLLEIVGIGPKSAEAIEAFLSK